MIAVKVKKWMISLMEPLNFVRLRAVRRLHTAVLMIWLASLGGGAPEGIEYWPMM